MWADSEEPAVRSVLFDQLEARVLLLLRGMRRLRGREWTEVPTGDVGRKAAVLFGEAY